VELYGQLVSVVFVIALAAAAAWWFRKGTAALSLRSWGRAGPDRRMQIVQRTPLTAQHCLHVVRVDRTEWIIATHPQGVTLLREGQPLTDERRTTK
jgi:flagellar biogenesis protein FliO